MSRQEEPVSLGRCRKLKEHGTGMTVLFIDEPERGEMWIPHDKVHDDSTLWEKSKIKTTCELVVNYSWAEWKGLV